MVRQIENDIQRGGQVPPIEVIRTPPINAPKYEAVQQREEVGAAAG